MTQPDLGSFDSFIGKIYFAAMPEFVPAKPGISPTGRYNIFLIHPVHGSCHLIIEQDNTCNWRSEIMPPFVKQALIDEIGDAIEKFDR